jgi:hypothetical protein
MDRRRRTGHLPGPAAHPHERTRQARPRHRRRLRYEPALYAGSVRPYALPVGKRKGTPLPIIGSVRPIAGGHFGEKVAVSSSLLAVYSSPATDGKKAVQIHQRPDMSLAAIIGVPGADVGEGVLHVTDNLIFAGTQNGPLHVFDLDDARPEVSYSIPLVQGLATDADYFYWGDKTAHRAPLPLSSVNSFAARLLTATLPTRDGDLNHDGRTDAIDLLLQHRLGKGMPVTIESLAPLAEEGTARRFRFALDGDIPEGTAVTLDYSTDLAGWSTLLTWDSAAARWRDAGGDVIGAAANEENESWVHEWVAPAGKVFFRTRVGGPE